MAHVHPKMHFLKTVSCMRLLVVHPPSRLLTTESAACPDIDFNVWEIWLQLQAMKAKISEGKWVNSLHTTRSIASLRNIRGVTILRASLCRPGFLPCSEATLANDGNLLTELCKISATARDCQCGGDTQLDKNTS